MANWKQVKPGQPGREHREHGAREEPSLAVAAVEEEVHERLGEHEEADRGRQDDPHRAA